MARGLLSTMREKMHFLSQCETWETKMLFVLYRHLARNPFHCDCRISWIADWLSANPVETSGARCEGPKKMHKRKLSSLREDQLKCYGKNLIEK